jgi:hypothetical protein
VAIKRRKTAVILRKHLIFFFLRLIEGCLQKHPNYEKKKKLAVHHLFLLLSENFCYKLEIALKIKFCFL